MRGANTAGNLGIDLETAARRKHDPRGGRLIAKGKRHRLGPNLAGVLEVFLFPELFEILGVRAGERGGVDLDDVVFHQGKGVVGHVSGAGPDRAAIAHDEFAVH